jgi:hypothetical protein
MVVLGVREMARRKLSPSEIVERLRLIDALTEDGRPIADAIRFAGLLPVEYDQWRREYAGLLRTLGPLACASPKLTRRWGRAGPGRPVRTAK